MESWKHVKCTRAMFLSSFVLIVLMGASQGHRPPCLNRQFHCINGKCLSSSEFCNGVNECGDNSDEIYCNINSEKDCPVQDGIHWKYCEVDKKCYPSAWICDGYRNCGDYSDEANCRPHLNCNGSQFSCSNRKCVQRGWFCDGENDCGDHSDEKYCGTLSSCPPLWNRCSNDMACYPSIWRCDGKPDCQDGSDEKFCSMKDDPEILGNTTVPLMPENQSGAADTRRNLTRYFLNTRKSESFINKWGQYITRTAVALFLRDKKFFASGNHTGEDIALEMSLKLMSKLALKKKITTQELSYFINGLTVACVNPREFFGLDMVAELRKQVNVSKYTNPFSILTLCNAKDSMTQKDIVKLQQLFDAHHRPVWTDAQAMVVMALACISNRPNIDFDERILNEMVAELKRAQYKNGTVDNLKSTALVVQALLATNSYQTDFNLSAAVTYMMQEVKNTNLHLQDMYYILPIFSSMSLINISSDHCVAPLKTDLEVMSNLQQAANERIQVQISIYIGDDMDFVRTWKIKVPSNFSFYHVLETIGTLDPRYKVEYSVSEGKPYITALNNFRDSIEENMFWFIYTKPISSTSKPKLIEQSPVEMQIRETEEVILWYRSGLWTDAEENTLNNTSPSK